MFRKMLTRFPFSMERIPRPKSFVCLSLKFGSLLSALTIIVYTVFIGLAQCLSSITQQPAHFTTWEMSFSYGYLIILIIAHLITLLLSNMMLIGVLKELSELIRPWVIWTSGQVMALIIVFMLWSTLSMIDNFGNTNLITYVYEFSCLLIRIYMLMLVASYCRQLEDEQEERRKTLLNEDTWYTA